MLCVLGRMYAIPGTLFTQRDPFDYVKGYFSTAMEERVDKRDGEGEITSLVFQISPSSNTLQSISVATMFSRVSWQCRANGVCLK